MNSFLWVLAAVLFILAVWFAWRYYDLKRHMDEFARLARISPESLPTDIKKIENLSSAIASLKSSFDLRLSTLDSENARLSTVLEQMIDGVIIADANGLIQLQTQLRKNF